MSGRVSEPRAALYPPDTKAFPRNTEIEATLTFAGSDPGQYVRDVTPTPTAITVRERQSFIALPEERARKRLTSRALHDSVSVIEQIGYIR